MTELKKRMLEDLQSHGYSNRTQELYLCAVCQLAEHYKKSPDLITEDEGRDYLLQWVTRKPYLNNLLLIIIVIKRSSSPP